MTQTHSRESEEQHQRLESWLIFWNQTWLYADVSWIDSLFNVEWDEQGAQTDMTKRQAIYTELMNFPLFETRARLGIEMSAPPKPGDALLQWLSLDEESCHYCLLLACDVVLKQRTEHALAEEGGDHGIDQIESDTHALDTEQAHECLANAQNQKTDDQTLRLSLEARSWARHIAKALMPGTWEIEVLKSLSPTQIGLALLRAWLSPPTWNRVRLRYQKSMVLSVENIDVSGIPNHRLNQLWYGVIWRVQVDALAKGNPNKTENRSVIIEQ
ncbi:hypothetical protein [Marinomonas balearica]|uniref:Uncharacterized protein n=1 Tax=Marinomonas balearica TaxID=491947 RepID=A0A4R6M4T0_9GAMM|nr:hypothetical protein [Marinomonas balearica]TDO96331.1 hypothetical protein DFP79_2904 [Marinomonas balearica]